MTAAGFKKHLLLLLGDLLTLTIALCIASAIPFIQTLKGIFPETALIYMLGILTPITVFISGYIVSRRYMIRFEHVQVIPEHIKGRIKGRVKNITAAGLKKTESGIRKSCMAIANFIIRCIVGLSKFILRFLLHFSIWVIPVFLMLTIGLLIFSSTSENIEFSYKLRQMFSLNSVGESIIGMAVSGALLISLGFIFIVTVIYALLSMLSVFNFKRIKSKKIFEGKTEQEIDKYKRTYFATVWGSMLVFMIVILTLSIFVVSGIIAYSNYQ